MPIWPSNLSEQVNSVAELRLLTTPPEVVELTGYAAPGDGGGGTFVYLGSGATPGDISVGGDDDGGFHIVNANGDIWQRQSDVVTPQMFGAQAAATVVLARAAADQAAAFQRAVDFWADPSSFPGMAFATDPPGGYKFHVPSGHYRCESSITVSPPGYGLDYRNAYTPGEFVMDGNVFTPHDDTVPGIVVSWWRTISKTRLVLNAHKDLNPATARAAWDYGTYPTRFVDDSVLREFDNSTEFYLDEEIVHVISDKTWVFKCTQTGTTDGVTDPTDVTGTEFTNGTAKFKCTGSARLAPTYNSVGKSMNDMLADNRDIGVWLDEMWEHDNITVSASNYCVGLALYPRSSTHAAVGWSSINSCHIQGCMVGVLLASYLGERFMAAGGRLTLCDFPIGGMVHEGTSPTDAGTKYRFDGPVGGESTAGNWSVDADWAALTAPAWVNDNALDLHLMYPFWLSSSMLTGNKSLYGVVLTSFGVSYGNNNNVIRHASMELPHWTKTDLNEAAQFLLYTGVGNQLHCRNEESTKSASMLAVQRNFPSEQPRANRVASSRAGKYLALSTAKLSRGGGYGNLLVDIPYDDGVSADRTVIFSRDTNWSSYDTVFARNYSLSNYPGGATAEFKNALTARINGGTAGPIYYPTDDSWGFDATSLPCLVIDLTDDTENLAVIRLDPHFSQDATLGVSRWYRWMAKPLQDDCFTFLDPSLWTAPPVRNITYSGGWGHPNVSSANKMVYSTPNSTVLAPLLMGVSPQVKYLILGIYGEHLRGFRVQVMGATARVFSPFHEGPWAGYSDSAYPVIDDVPEKGIIQAPATFRFRSGTAANQLAELNKAHGAKYYCTSGETGDLTPGNNYQWGHDGGVQGSATISQWNGTGWDQIATNAYYAETTDFGSFDLST